MRPMCLWASRVGKQGSRDARSAESASNSLCYLEQLPVLPGAQVSRLENNTGGLDDIKDPFQI